jgi:hypothetical protein
MEPTNIKIILSSKHRSSKWSLSLRLLHQNPVHVSALPIRATWPAHLILLDLITRTICGKQYRPLSSSLCSFLHSLVNSSLLGPDIFVSTLLFDTLSQKSSFQVTDQVPQQHKTKVRITVLCILIFLLLGSTLEVEHCTATTNSNCVNHSTYDCCRRRRTDAQSSEFYIKLTPNNKLVIIIRPVQNNFITEFVTFVLQILTPCSTECKTHTVDTTAQCSAVQCICWQ